MNLHLEDPDLIRLLDNAIEPQDRIAVERHVATCSICAERLRLIERRIDRLEDLLVAGDPMVPATSRVAPRRISRLVAVAATVAVLVAVAVTVQPVRAWIVERSQDLWTLVAGGSTRDNPEHRQVDDSPTATSASVTFVPVRQPFIIRISRQQAQGSVTVETSDGSDVTAVVVGGGDTEDLLVLPDGLLVRNSDESVASYRVTVPASLDTVRVEVEGRVVVTLAPRGGQSRWTGALGGSDPR